MHNKRLIITAAFVTVTCLCAFAEGAKFTILSMNTKTIKIGNKQLKFGDSFTEGDIREIKWISDKQFLKVRNEVTKRTQILTQRTIGKKVSPSLGDYLVKTKRLATRSWNDTIIQLPDTVALDVPVTTNDKTLYAAFWNIGEDSILKPLLMSDDGQQLFITRELFGTHVPQESYFKILKYDLTKDSEPDSIGWLHIEPLPLIIE